MRWAVVVLVIAMQSYAIPLEDLIKEAESVAVPVVKRVDSDSNVVKRNKVIEKRGKVKVDRNRVREDRYVMDLGEKKEIKRKEVRMEYIGKINGCEIYKGKGGYQIKCRGKK